MLDQSHLSQAPETGLASVPERPLVPAAHAPRMGVNLTCAPSLRVGFNLRVMRHKQQCGNPLRTLTSLKKKAALE